MRTAIGAGVIVVAALSVVPGCGRHVEWGRRTWNQGKTVAHDVKPAREHLRSVTLYDQFTTLASFDALYLSDRVRALYAMLSAKLRGKPSDQTKVGLRRQLEENEQFITFLVLSTHEVPLDGSHPEWHLTLAVDGKEYSPDSVNAVALSPEYRHLFGLVANRFKGAYEVLFNKYKGDKRPIIKSNSRSIAMHFRSTKRQTALAWDLTKLDTCARSVVAT